MTKNTIILITFTVFATVIGWSVYQRAKVWWTASDQEIVAKSEYAVAYWKHKTATIVRNDTAIFYVSLGAVVSVLGAAILGFMVLTTGKRREMVQRASVFTAKIGRSEVPVHYQDLSKLGPVYAGLTAAEQMRETNAGQMDALTYLKKFADIAVTMTHNRALMDQDTPAAGMLPVGRTPTFADLLRAEAIAPGKPLIVGYRQGEPQCRDMKALKSLAVAGWQGSGKTLSMGYLIASTALAYEARIYVIDPHKGHDEGLYTLIQPLEATGQLHVINPFDTPRLIGDLNATLDRRLRGDESSRQAILLVIDELARLADLDCFDTLIKFLERCTQETRKANVTFIGGSQKWTARHFKGRADIRACMNSALVHKTKPSQAELLLEDGQEKKLVKQLQQPGDAILVTDFADARLVSMPFCTRQDMETVADLIGKRHAPLTITATEATLPDNQTKSALTPVTILTPQTLTEHLQAGWSQRRIERATGVNQSKISNFVRGNASALSDDEQRVIVDLITHPEAEKFAAEDAANQTVTIPTMADNQVMA